MTVRVGLTGGVASGKSTVSAILAELGAVVIDADALAREVVARGTPGLDAVVAEFGPALLTPEGDLDRPAMGAPGLRRRVGPQAAGGDHPPPGASSGWRRSRPRRGEDDVVVHDIPLLAEGGRADTFDAVVVVDAPRDLQVQRMLSRPRLDPRGRRVADRRPGHARGAAARSPPTSSTTPARSTTCASRVEAVLDELRG